MGPKLKKIEITKNEIKMQISAKIAKEVEERDFAIEAQATKLSSIGSQLHERVL